MLLINEKELQKLLQAQYQKGVKDGTKMGIRLMEERLLLACENGNPVGIKGRAYFVRSDIQNLRDIMDEIVSNDL